MHDLDGLQVGFKCSRLTGQHSQLLLGSLLIWSLGRGLLLPGAADPENSAFGLEPKFQLFLVFGKTCLYNFTEILWLYIMAL